MTIAVDFGRKATKQTNTGFTVFSIYLLTVDNFNVLLAYSDLRFKDLNFWESRESVILVVN